ncbi:uncharacterized protein HD556DRAFT_1442085 [Suillus plorans]|uniref:Uncharacterized protein n=1 Tax=Suillus plorans TaxID=116603 RepID=A0A9P7ASS4_9AGAM|nr:uncharacterized protein HD556DRAFT_1442085 [Suillus plorans]KAG1795762.1 hypothetical protein HD556DRAFT_1442085 [Suillus plorans]
MLSSWLSKKSNNTQALSQPDQISKASRSTVELTGHSSQSAIPITDDDHNDVHEHIWDPSTYSTQTEQDVLRPNPSATSTSSDVKSLGQSTEPVKFLTPHDDILAELQGYLPSSGPQAAERSSLRPDAPQGSSLNLSSSAAENSLFTSDSSPNHEPAREVMYEPFTGQKLSDYVPMPVRSGADDELWSHLSHILELQSEISKMHVDMENVGLRTARGHNVPERGGKAGTTRKETGKNRRSDTLGEEEDDNESDEATEGEDSDDNDEVFGKRKRDEEFTGLAERFAERKVSIDAVMNKLGDLSSTLKAFHALPIPVLDIASTRTNTMSSDASLSTDRGTGVTSAVTSTTSAPPRMSVQVTTIIDDSQHVDSPVDVHFAQSILDRNVGKK